MKYREWQSNQNNKRKLHDGRLSNSEYSKYIQSAAWRAKKQAYLKSKLSNDCGGCQAVYTAGFHLHHRTYRRLGKERLNDLVMLCPRCHELVHDQPLIKKDLWKTTKVVLNNKRKKQANPINQEANTLPVIKSSTRKFKR